MSNRDRAIEIARGWASNVWLSACDVRDIEPPDPENAPGAHVLCDACDRGAGPTHGALAIERSAEYLAEIERRGIADGETIPPEVFKMDEAPDGFDGWPDPLEIEHEKDCPVGFMLELAGVGEPGDSPG